MPRKRYDTPHRSRVVKTRMTEEEYADFAARLAPYGISQSEFIRSQDVSRDKAKVYQMCTEEYGMGCMTCTSQQECQRYS